MVRFRDLTEDEISLLCNGCGGKGGPIDPPDWMFEASCNHHDFNYRLGGTEKDRLEADRQFRDAMLRDAERAGNFFTRWWYRRMAHLYYRAVRAFGGKYFHYRPEGYEPSIEELVDEALRELDR